MASSAFSLVVDTWDLHRRSRRDVERHNQRVRAAIKGNLGEIISQSDVITSDGRRLIKVPIRGIELPRFRFDPHRDREAGQGDEGTRGAQGQPGSGGTRGGRTRPGTVLGQSSGQADGKEAGQMPGQPYYEAEITVDELLDVAFEDMGLPNLEEKGEKQVTVTSLSYNTIRKTGQQANLDTRRTLIEAYKRNARLGAPGWGVDETQDPRYRSWEEIHEPRRNAVVFAMRDVSGSMGEFEVYVCRTFYTWMVRFLRRKYTSVEVVFVTCHTEAQEVGEEEFFHQASSGGTRLASAYALALDIIAQRYSPASWNIYPFLFSDGYNWGDDECVGLVRRFLQIANLVGYGEVDDYGYWAERRRHAGSAADEGNVSGAGVDWAPLGRLYDQALGNEGRFVRVQITRKEDVWPALRRFMQQRHAELSR